MLLPKLGNTGTFLSLATWSTIYFLYMWKSSSYYFCVSQKKENNTELEWHIDTFSLFIFRCIVACVKHKCFRGSWKHVFTLLMSIYHRLDIKFDVRNDLCVFKLTHLHCANLMGPSIAPHQNRFCGKGWSIIKQKTARLASHFPGLNPLG